MTGPEYATTRGPAGSDPVPPDASGRWALHSTVAILEFPAWRDMVRGAVPRAITIWTWTSLRSASAQYHEGRIVDLACHFRHAVKQARDVASKSAMANAEDARERLFAAIDAARADAAAAAEGAK